MSYLQFHQDCTKDQATTIRHVYKQELVHCDMSSYRSANGTSSQLVGTGVNYKQVQKFGNMVHLRTGATQWNLSHQTLKCKRTGFFARALNNTFTTKFQLFSLYWRLKIAPFIIASSINIWFKH